ncbi:MAG: glycosyl transferase family 1, partial [Frankiaceae bacterium]
MLDVTPPAHDLDRLAPFTGAERASAMASLAAGARDALAGRTVWNVNSTATGGGVAEMLAQLVAYGQGAGVATRWLVAEGNSDFFALTKRLHNRLHGA